MKENLFPVRRAAAWLGALFLLLLPLVTTQASTSAAAGVRPLWKADLPAAGCPGSSNNNCHHASPVVADVTGDGKLEIVVATNAGHILLYRHDGKMLWDRDVAPAFGMGKNTQRIDSSPAVADIDADGRMEIVAGTGTLHSTLCTQGGVIVLEHDGSVKKGWPFLTQDEDVPPAGCRDSVFATPALGDLDRDGDLEIVFASFDKRIYALHHNGRALPGYPPDSYHYTRFEWPNLRGRLTDTIWSSPALADVNGDGYLDVVTGADEGNFDNSWAPVLENWTCPYRVPGARGYCGGAIYAFDRLGHRLPGFPRYKYEIIQSSPALYDANEDGRSEIFVGTGSYYHLNSPDHPQNGFRLFGLDSTGQDLPGWGGGIKMGGVVTASPSVGDITGDGEPEVVVAARDKKLYAFHLNGRAVNGFPMVPKMNDGQVLDPYDVGTGFILADYTGDGKMEIFLRHAWEIVVVDGQGRQLTARAKGDGRPAYITDGPLWNNPAVGDLNGDGRLELVAQNSKLFVWSLPSSSTKADWPMFKQNAARSASIGPSYAVAPDHFLIPHKKNSAAVYELRLHLSSYLGGLDWTLKSDNSGAISLPRSSGSVMGEALVMVRVKVGADQPSGNRRLGTLTLTIVQGGKEMTMLIPINVNTMKNMKSSYLPVSP